MDVRWMTLGSSSPSGTESFPPASEGEERVESGEERPLRLQEANPRALLLAAVRRRFLLLLLFLRPDGEVSREVRAMNSLALHELLVAVTSPGTDCAQRSVQCHGVNYTKTLCGLVNTNHRDNGRFVKRTAAKPARFYRNEKPRLPSVGLIHASCAGRSRLQDPLHRPLDSEVMRG